MLVAENIWGKIMSFGLNHLLIPEFTRAIVFDWDDTVVGTIEAKLRQHIYVAEKHYGITLTPSEMILDWGKPLHQLIEKWYQIEPGNESQFDEVLKTVLSYSGEYLKLPFAGASDVLAAVKSERYALGVVTGSPHNDIFHDFEVTGIQKDMFDYFQASDDSEFHKPDPRVFDPTNHWLETIGVAPQEVLYIGDSMRDFQAAAGTGYNFLGVETAANDMPSFYMAGALSIRAIGDLIRR